MRKDLGILFSIFVVIGILPLFIHGNLELMNIITMCLVWSVVASSWDLIMGFAGIFTFAQVAFFVIGAYASAILTKSFGISPWFGIIIGGGITFLFGLIVGLPCLKLKGAYVALVTFAVHMVLDPILKSDFGRMIGTGGTQGLLSIPSFKIGGYTYTSFEPVPWFYTAMVLSFVSLFLIFKIIHSSWGLAFIAVRDSEPFAKSLGINEFKYKLLVFGISAGLTGMIGAFYAHFIGVLSARLLGLDLFLILMVMLVLGGLGRFPGALIGTFITVFLSEFLRPLETWRPIIFGAIVVLLVLFIPQGITGILFPDNKPGPLEKIKRYFKKSSASAK